jgi:hypothetical protein
MATTSEQAPVTGVVQGDADDAVDGTEGNER